MNLARGMRGQVRYGRIYEGLDIVICRGSFQVQTSELSIAIDHGRASFKRISRRKLVGCTKLRSLGLECRGSE